MRRFRHMPSGIMRVMTLAILMIMAVDVKATATAEEISNAILSKGSLPIKWGQQAYGAWTVVSSESGSFIKCVPYQKKGITSIDFTFEALEYTRVEFEWYQNSEDSKCHFFLYIDGYYYTKTDAASWDSFYFYVEKGTHTIKFSANLSESQSENFKYEAGLRYLRVGDKPINGGDMDISEVILRSDSQPISFENDSINIWGINMWDGNVGTVISSTSDFDNKLSRISTTFTIDQPMLLSYQTRIGEISPFSGAQRITNVYVDGQKYRGYTGTGWQYDCIFLESGTHKVDFEHWHREKGFWSEIKNVCLNSNWMDFKLDNPGDLERLLVDAFPDGIFTSAEMVRITGDMNETDWNNIAKLSTMGVIDLSNASITAIPDRAFISNTCLNTAILPEWLESIGEEAFRQIKCDKIYIPASVKSIGHRACQGAWLRSIEFAADSKLEYIGYGAFNGANQLTEFKMPDSVLRLGTYSDVENVELQEWLNDYSNIFQECLNLRKLHLSENLTALPRTLAYKCPVLEEVNIPARVKTIGIHALASTSLKEVSLPDSVVKIGKEAFAYTSLERFTLSPNVSDIGEGILRQIPTLKEVTLNAHVKDLNKTLKDCIGLEKVTLPCALPPSVLLGEDEPFVGVEKENISLFVPEFSLQKYRNSSYWSKFKSIDASDEATVRSYWKVDGELALDSDHLMPGTPTLELVQGSHLTIRKDTPQEFNEIIYATGSDKEIYNGAKDSFVSSFMNESALVKGKSVIIRYGVDKQRTWQFFSPSADVAMKDISFTGGDIWVIRYYDGARRALENSKDGNWIDMPADGMLKRGNGYIFHAPETGWLIMPVAEESASSFIDCKDTVIELNDNKSVTPDDNGVNSGWNFVGNPFPCYYDIYYIDMQAPITVWDGSSYKAYSLLNDDRDDDKLVLRPMQPFFVQKASAQQKVGMMAAGRQSDDEVRRHSIAKKPHINPDRLKLNLEIFSGGNEKADDYTRIVLNENASMTYEPTRDASKFMSLDKDVAQLYSLDSYGNAMAINERPYADGAVGLGIFIPESGSTYTISAVRADRKAWLYDSVLGLEHEISSEDYTFVASKAGVDTKRFKIHFKSSGLGVDFLNESSVKVAGGVGVIVISLNENVVADVYGADGVKTASVSLEPGTIELPASSGLHMVMIDGRTYKTIVK